MRRKFRQGKGYPRHLTWQDAHQVSHKMEIVFPGSWKSEWKPQHGAIPLMQCRQSVGERFDQEPWRLFILGLTHASSQFPIRIQDVGNHPLPQEFRDFKGQVIAPVHELAMKIVHLVH